MALALAEQAGVEPQLAMKLGPFSCFCLCVERGSLDAGAAMLLAQAGVRGEMEGNHGGLDPADADAEEFNHYDYYPPAPVQDDASDQEPLLLEAEANPSSPTRNRPEAPSDGPLSR
mmetsp:Transcript_134115/g.189497  ORF Transcript_134115/g.189497 Transcript_134115/m.189497 type:complete len:116 (-) Transcript_134115:44-391(-)|eukprot:s4047_g8.t1